MTTVGVPRLSQHTTSRGPKTTRTTCRSRSVITKAQELFGFRCAVGLEEGIQRVWDYFLWWEENKMFVVCIIIK
jgi:hypothetical protein